MILLFITFTSLGQAKKEWKAGYMLSVVDFEAEPPPLAGGPGFYLAAHLDFGNTQSISNNNQLLNANTYFYPSLSWLQQGEGTETWLKMAQMDFDLLELFARNYRQRLYGNKKAFIDQNIRKEIQREIKTEMAQWQVEMNKAVSESDVKRNAFHERILIEIANLDQYCKKCIPLPKKN